MATFFNQATLSYTNGTVTSNTVSGELVEVISATKNTMQSSYSAGDTITYIINLQNSGSTVISGITVTDDLGDYTGATTPTAAFVPLTYVPGTLQYYSNGILQATPTITATDPLTITGISIPAGGNVTLLYNASVNEYAPLQTASSIVNTATIGGTSLANTITAIATLPVTTNPELSISKSITPDTVTTNGEITYTFTILNTGNVPADSSDNLIVTDQFNPILSNLSVVYNGTVWAPTTNYTYDATSGLFETVAGQITVPAATYTQNPTTGAFTTTPGITTLKVTGTV